MCSDQWYNMCSEWWVCAPVQTLIKRYSIARRRANFQCWSRSVKESDAGFVANWLLLVTVSKVSGLSKLNYIHRTVKLLKIAEQICLSAVVKYPPARFSAVHERVSYHNTHIILDTLYLLLMDPLVHKVSWLEWLSFTLLYLLAEFTSYLGLGHALFLCAGFERTLFGRTSHSLEVLDSDALVTKSADDARATGAITPLGASRL